MPSQRRVRNAHQKLVNVDESEPLVAVPERLVADVVDGQLRAVVDRELQVRMVEPVHPAQLRDECITR